jgi:hypothetical protein
MGRATFTTIIDSFSEDGSRIKLNDVRGDDRTYWDQLAIPVGRFSGIAVGSKITFSAEPRLLHNRVEDMDHVQNVKLVEQKTDEQLQKEALDEIQKQVNNAPFGVVVVTTETGKLKVEECDEPDAKTCSSCGAQVVNTKRELGYSSFSVVPGKDSKGLIIPADPSANLTECWRQRICPCCKLATLTIPS